MNYLSVFIHTRIKGFILGYSLYLLTFLLSFSLIIAESMKSKVETENNLLILEEEKCIELVVYSYFTNDLCEDSMMITCGDYDIDYEVTKEGLKTICTCNIEKDDIHYSIIYTYDQLSQRVESIEYST